MPKTNKTTWLSGFHDNSAKELQKGKKRREAAEVPEEAIPDGVRAGDAAERLAGHGEVCNVADAQKAKAVGEGVGVDVGQGSLAAVAGQLGRPIGHRESSNRPQHQRLVEEAP